MNSFASTTGLLFWCIILMLLPAYAFSAPQTLPDSPFPQAYFEPQPQPQSQPPPEPSAESQSNSQFQELLSFGKVVTALVLLLLIFISTKLIGLLLEGLSERFSNQRLLIKRFIPIFRLLTWTVGLYIIITAVFNPPIETVITVSASIGIAVGFASQDILRNVFGGLMIILDRPFQVGDKIDIGGHYGEVSEIGLRSVRLITPDDSVVSVPNGELMNKAVSNTNSSALDCQVVCDIFLPTDVDIQQMRRLGRRAAFTSRYVYLNKPIVVNVLNETKANRSFAILRVKAYVLDIRYEFRFKSDVSELILQELSDKGISAGA